MRKLVLIRRGLFTVVAAMLSLAAFFLGRATVGLWEEPNTGEYGKYIEEAETDAVSGSGVQLPPDAYLLKREGGTMIVVCGSTVVASFEKTMTHMSEEAEKRLDQGIVFQTLGEIESYIEGHDS